MPGKTPEKTEKARPAFGRKQFDNVRNYSAGGGARATFGNYSQTHGTITSSGLNALKQNRW